MKKHATLSASGASRWLACSPSARLEETMEEVESEYANEGTLAHELGEWLIREKVWGVDVSNKVKKIQESEYYNEEMYDYCEEYAEYVAEVYRESPEGSVLIQEQRLNLVEFIPEGFGTVDNAIIGGNVLTIIDLKYGKGVPVDAYENKQMMVYGLGVLGVYDLIYHINTVRMTIYQPRIDNTSTYEISVENLIQWGYEVLRPGALKAFQGIGEFVPGPHCKFCRVRATCKANASYNLVLAAREFDPPTVTDEQIVKFLNRAQQMKNWITAVEEYALRMAIQGKKWPGMKVVVGRSNRRYKDADKVAKILIEKGHDPEKLFNKKLIALTNLKKVIGKADFTELVEPELDKPPGAPTLVSEDDTRPEYNANEAAKNDFS